jgi:hypothetical protein
MYFGTGDALPTDPGITPGQRTPRACRPIDRHPAWRARPPRQGSDERRERQRGILTATRLPVRPRPGRGGRPGSSRAPSASGRGRCRWPRSRHAAVTPCGWRELARRCGMSLETAGSTAWRSSPANRGAWGEPQRDVAPSDQSVLLRPASSPPDTESCRSDALSTSCKIMPQRRQSRQAAAAGDWTAPRGAVHQRHRDVRPGRHERHRSVGGLLRRVSSDVTILTSAPVNRFSGRGCRRRPSARPESCHLPTLRG